MALRLVIRGVVQGVGMRPFIHRLAHKHGLAGTVANSARGVVVEVEGRPESVAAFERRLTEEPPPLARVDRVSRETIPPLGLRWHGLSPGNE